MWMQDPVGAPIGSIHSDTGDGIQHFPRLSGSSTAAGRHEAVDGAATAV
jgi:hypothetical protein